jgi:hypothetical protein
MALTPKAVAQGCMAAEAEPGMRNQNSGHSPSVRSNASPCIEVVTLESAESSQTQQRFGAIASALASEPSVSVGSSGKKGFGSSALQVGGKIFAMISSNGSFVVRLPKHRVEALEDAGAGQRFDPGHGRLMKEWLSLDSSSNEDWLSLAREALSFVASMPKT